MKRYLSVWFPDWPLTRLRRARRRQPGRPHPDSTGEAPEPAHPFILIEDGPHGLAVAAANPSARKLGISEGLGLPDARARCPHLKHERIDRDADARALQEIAAWMIRLAPLVAVDGPDGLMLETTGCAHLHGGESAMLDVAAGIFSRNGLPYQLGLAGTPGAASALARARPGHVLGEGEETAGLADLPVTALRLTPEALTLLKRFGLTRIGQLYGVDRRALARRFQSRADADAVLRRLDQALGLRHEPIAPLRPVPALARRLACPEPLKAREGLTAGLRPLAGEVCEDLKSRGQGARGFTFHAFRADGGASCISIALARPVRTPAHILRLFEEKLDRIDPGFGIDLLMLEARRAGPMETSMPALAGELAAGDTDPVRLSALADRITARLGEGSVSVIQQSESHLPERAEQHAAFTGTLAPYRPCRAGTGPRPLRLLSPPESIEVMAEVPDGPPRRFAWRRIPHLVVRADGPERIAPEWWRHTATPAGTTGPAGADRKWLAPKLDPRGDALQIAAARRALEDADPGTPVSTYPRARDYYRVEDRAGHRFWLFREGLYADGRGAVPAWFIHGIFA